MEYPLCLLDSFAAVSLFYPPASTSLRINLAPVVFIHPPATATRT